MIENVTCDKVTFNTLFFKFEAGTPTFPAPLARRRH